MHAVLPSSESINALLVPFVRKFAPYDTYGACAVAFAREPKHLPFANARQTH
jgi:hypothetical protein